MDSNSFHDLIGPDVVHYSFGLACRVATVSDKTHATKLSHFIKFFFLFDSESWQYSFFSSCELLRALHEWVYFLKEFGKNRFRESKKFNERFSSMRRRDIEILKTTEWSADLALLNSYFFEDCNISTKTRFFWKFYFDLNVCLVFEDSLMFEKYMWESKISRESFVNVLFYWVKSLDNAFTENFIKIHIWKIVKA